jgi:membrane-associated HD superfamily phosphohydrolase
MTEPNPGRIEGLVRRISRTRLDDGQFDHCDLSFRELRLIEDAIISRLCAIHHSRISYPSTAGSGSGNGQRSTDHIEAPKTTAMLKPATSST